MNPDEPMKTRQPSNSDALELAVREASVAPPDSCEKGPVDPDPWTPPGESLELQRTLECSDVAATGKAKRGKGWGVAVVVAFLAIALAVGFSVRKARHDRAMAELIANEEAAQLLVDQARKLRDVMVPALVTVPGHEPRQILVDATEVTVERFRECVQAGACKEEDFNARTGYMDAGVFRTYEHDGCNFVREGAEHDRQLHPMNCVGLQAARDYCAWKGKRLPYDFEWRYGMEHQVDVARKTENGDCRWWGPRETVDEEAVTYVVGTHPANAGPFRKEGAATHMMDVDGNVAEWVNVTGDGWYGGSPKERVGAMAGWVYTETWMRCLNQEELDASERLEQVGFRCVKDVEGPGARDVGAEAGQPAGTP